MTEREKLEIALRYIKLPEGVSWLKMEDRLLFPGHEGFLAVLQGVKVPNGDGSRPSISMQFGLMEVAHSRTFFANLEGLVLDTAKQLVAMNERGKAMEIKDRDFSFHYPAKVEGSPSLLRVVHKPTGCQAEGYLSDRDAIIEGVKRQVAKIGNIARDVIEKAKEPVDA